MIKSSLLALLLGACIVNAHMIMLTPKPFAKYKSGSVLNNSPLEDGGGDFPCKNPVYDGWPGTSMAVGSKQELTFQGSAVHGGGSCQVSLSKDLNPTQKTTWQVIHSYEGGCPANVDGNLPANPSGTGAPAHPFTVPEGVEPGKYVLAWSWLNRIGNREFYMNCAPVTITGGSKRSYQGFEQRSTEELATNSTKSLAKRASFPPMFVANINGCITKESVDVVFPNPGSSCTKGGNAANLAKTKGCTGTAKFAGEGNTAGSSGDSGGDSGSGSETTSSAAPAATSAAPDPAASSSAPAEPASTSTPASSGGGGSSGGSSGGSCTSGTFKCTGGSSFQQCDHGYWAVMQQMAAGTACTEGISQDLGIHHASKRTLHKRFHWRRNHLLSV